MQLPGGWLEHVAWNFFSQLADRPPNVRAGETCSEVKHNVRLPFHSMRAEPCLTTGLTGSLLFWGGKGKGRREVGEGWRENKGKREKETVGLYASL